MSSLGGSTRTPRAPSGRDVRTWAWLGAAIGSEVAASLALKAAQDAPGWYAVVVAGYVGAFALLALVLGAGMALGVAYGVWGATGVALTAVLGAVVFGETLTPVMVAGLGFVVVGVLLVELGARPDDGAGAP